MTETSPDYVRGAVFAILAGLTTVMGMLFIPLVNAGADYKTSTATALAFAAGVMMWVAFVDVLGEEARNFFDQHYTQNPSDTAETSSRLWVSGMFLIGMAMTIFLNQIVSRCVGEPETPASQGGVALTEVKDQEEGNATASPEVKPDADIGKSNLPRVAAVATIGLALHNFPEGLATFFDGSTGGVTVALAIAMHNIPEGAAIAVPVYLNEKSYWAAFKATFLAGAAQPLGAIIGWILLSVFQSSNLPDFLYGCLYSLTAGIMVGLSLVGLIPEALTMATPERVGVSIGAGFVVMEFSILCLGWAGL